MQKLGFEHRADIDEFFGPCSQFVWTADVLNPSDEVAEQNVLF
ncbi:hypothetical protein VMA_001579 [Vibrio mimicus VM223]|nr:hypothetical protein VMA_001579 [Vibrio mimicus VM223]